MITLKLKGTATLADGTEHEVVVELDVTEQSESEDGTISLYGAGDAWRVAFKPATSQPGSAAPKGGHHGT